MKLLELAKTTIVLKKELRETEPDVWVEQDYYGNLYDELKEHFSKEATIDFNKSFKSLRKIAELNNNSNDKKKLAIEIEKQTLLGRSRFITNLEDYDKNAERINDLTARMSEIDDIDTVTQSTQIIEALGLVVVDNDEVYKTVDDFLELEAMVLSNLILLATSFFTKKNKVTPLKKKY